MWLPSALAEPLQLEPRHDHQAHHRYLAGRSADITRARSSRHHHALCDQRGDSRRACGAPNSTPGLGSAGGRTRRILETTFQMTQAAGGCGATCGIAPGCGRAATTATSAAPMLVRVAWRHSQELATGMMRVSRLDALVALAFCLVAGYFLADVWSRS